VLFHNPSPGLELETRARWKIPNELRLERPKVALEASVAIFRASRPNARLRSLTATYNCVGLVVACRRTWVDPEHLVRILRDDGYRQLAGPEQAEIGDLVIYRDGANEVSHVGIVVRKKVLVPGQQEEPLEVVSKWGADGEYIHDMSYVPKLLGKPVEFWTDRKDN